MSEPTNSVLSTRVDQAAKIMKVDPKIVWERLAILGIDKDDESLILLESDMTQEGDARRVFVELHSVERVGDANPIGVPIVRFKAGWAILKGKCKDVQGETGYGYSNEGLNPNLKSILDAMKTPAQMSDSELLKQYTPTASSNIIDELKQRSNDRAFIVFDETKGNDAVDVETSLKLLRIARRQETPATYKVGTKLCRVHRLGEFPMVFVEECPIHADVLLVEDYCEKCMESFEGISYDDRVLIRVAKNIGAIDVSNLAKIHELLENVKAKGSDFLMGIPAVQMTYDELKSEGRLPNLRRKFSASRSGKSDPFFQKF